MTVDINDLRLSLLWTEPSLTLLDEPAPAGAPLAALGRRYSYESLFKKILESHFGANAAKDLPLHLLVGAAKPLPILGPPWPKPSGQLFWHRYLNVGSLDAVSGSQAWHSLVPLRVKFPCYVETPDWLANSPKPLTLSVLFEAFFYPHGVAFVANAVIRSVPSDPAAEPPKPFTLEDAADLAFKVKQEKFKTRWEGEAGLFQAVKWDDEADSELTLGEIAKRGLAALRVAAHGASTTSGSASILDPFTIFTVVKGVGVNPATPVDDNIHRVLEGVTRWSDTWRYDALPALDKMKVEIKTSPVSHVLYGRKRGRAAWFPATFTKTDKKYSLACYHRNLIFASLQVESLCGFTALIAKMIQNKEPLSVSLSECVRQAGGTLGRLYGKGDKSYRSMSPRVQIEQNQYSDDIITVRKFLGMGDVLQ
jgi:hypothetical protein